MSTKYVKSLNHPKPTECFKQSESSEIWARTKSNLFNSSNKSLKNQVLAKSVNVQATSEPRTT